MKLLTITGDAEVEKVDEYWASDQRAVSHPRCDYVRLPSGDVVPYKANVAQSITIEPNEAKSKGTVKDALTGTNIDSALVYAVMLDPDLPEDWPESSFFSGFDGKYQVNAIYAGDCLIVCEKEGYETQEIPITLEAGQTVTIDFNLERAYYDW